MSPEAEPARTVSWRGPARGSPAALELALAELRRGLSPHGLGLREAAEGERAELILEDDLSVRAATADGAASTLDSPSLLAGLARFSAGRSAGGIAVEIAAAEAELDWHAALRALGAGPLEIVATNAAAAARASEVLRGLERARRLDVSDGAGLAAALAGRRLVIASSLDVALVALAHGVPFLLAGSGEAPPAALADRGLGSWRFAAADELVGKASTMLSLGLDLGPLVRRDLAALESRLARLTSELGGAGGRAVAESAAAPPAISPPALHCGVAASGDGDAERIARNLRPMIERLGGDLQRLHHEVASQRARIDELAGEVDRQSGEIARREALLRDILESRAWRLVAAIREAVASVRRALGGAGRAGDRR